MAIPRFITVLCHVPHLHPLALHQVLAAMSVGIAARCMDVMAQYSVDRKAFGKSLSNFGQIQKHLAESYAKYTAGRTYLYKVANEMKLDQVVGN